MKTLILFALTWIAAPTFALQGGQPLDEASSPAVRLYRRGGHVINDTVCSGVRIGRDHVLTAAHCILTSSITGRPQKISVAYAIRLPNELRSHLVSRTVEALQLHPSLNSKTWVYSENDLGILQRLLVYDARFLWSMKTKKLVDLALLTLSPPEISFLTGVIVRTFAHPHILGSLETKFAETHSFGFSENLWKQKIGEGKLGIIEYSGKSTNRFIEYRHGFSGIIQGGDSGSGAFVRKNGELLITGILSQGGLRPQELPRGRIDRVLYTPAYRICDFNLNDDDLLAIRSGCSNEYIKSPDRS
jgi:hypothetical protein